MVYEAFAQTVLLILSPLLHGRQTTPYIIYLILLILDEETVLERSYFAQRCPASN